MKITRLVEKQRATPYYFLQINLIYAMEKREPLQQMMLGKLFIYLQKTETRPHLSPCTKLNSKWVKNVNLNLEAMQVSRGKNLVGDIHIGNYL
jgi:hypothetical protein